MTKNLHLDWSWHIFNVFSSLGVVDIVVSPGSRSTPLVVAASKHPRLRLHSVIDERCAAFVGLGLSRGRGVPAVLVCTSGTAAAHYLPAIIEAYHAGIPLIALTADRPFELTAAGEPQMIDQTRLFGSAVRDFFELSAPDTFALPMLRRRAAQIVAAATSGHPGPVHVNARFRKPLEPTDAGWDPPDNVSSIAYVNAPPTVPDAAVGLVTELFRSARRPAVVAGPQWGIEGAQDESALLRLNAPIFAEITSGKRVSSQLDVIGSLDWVADVWERYPNAAPDAVVECGMLPVSGAYQRWIAHHPDVTRVVAHPSLWSDPAGTAAVHVRCPPWRLLAEVGNRCVTSASQQHYKDQWKSAYNAWFHAILNTIERFPINEISVAHQVARLLPDGSNLFVGNSLAVRDLDLSARLLAPTTRVFHQRGAAGIDGLVSGAVGIVDATERPTTLLVGDVSFLHDVGGLHGCARVRSPLVIVVLDNQGGRIFEALPIAKHTDLNTSFHHHFITAPDLDFTAVGKAFGVSAQRVDDIPTFSSTYRAALKTPGCTLIVVTVDPDESRKAREFLHNGPDVALLNEQVGRLFSQTAPLICGKSPAGKERRSS